MENLILCWRWLVDGEPYNDYRMICEVSDYKDGKVLYYGKKALEDARRDFPNAKFINGNKRWLYDSDGNLK